MIYTNYRLKFRGCLNFKKFVFYSGEDIFTA